MELTPAKFLALFLFLSATGWLLFTFAARLAAWILSRMMGAEVRFRIGGLNCLKDISLNFKKGSLESLMIGEVRLCVLRSSTGSHDHTTERAFMLQVLLYDTEVVLRKTQSTTRVSQLRKQSSGRGKWMILANIAKYVSVLVVELVVQVRNWNMEVKELDLKMDSEETGLSLLNVRLMLMACIFYEREQHLFCDKSCSLNLGKTLLSVGGSGSRVDGTQVPFSLERLSIKGTFGHEREQGVTIRQLDVTCGEVSVNLDEELFYGANEPPENISVTDNAEPDLEVTRLNQLEGVVEGSSGARHHSLMKNVPEKASFSLPKLLLKCCHKEKIFVLENEVRGIQIICTKVQTSEGSGDSSSCLDIHMDCGEIQLLREADMSFVEIMKLAVAASIEISKLPNSLPQGEVDVKLGGAQCNLLLNKFEKLMYMFNSIRPKGKGRAAVPKRKSALSQNGISWTCTLSAPDMAVLVYSLDGRVLYNTCLQTSHVFINSVYREGTGIHTELGELHVYLVDEEHDFDKENLFGLDTNPGCLLQLSRVTVDWGVTEPESTKNGTDLRSIALVMEVTGSALYLTLHRLQSLLSSITHSIIQLKKLVTGSTHKMSKGRTTEHKERRRGVQEVKLCLEGFCFQFCEQLHVVNMNVPDRKKVNFGTQGGEVVFETNDDGQPRMASIKAVMFDGIEGSGLICKSTIDIAHFQLCIDRDKGITQVDLQRMKTSYHELGSAMQLVNEVNVAALQSGKIVYQTVAMSDGVPGCLICATDVRGRWEPDIQLFFHDIFVRLKIFIEKQKQLLHPAETATVQKSSKGSDADHKRVKNHGPAVAVDIHGFDFSAALADGVEGSLSIASVFSEDFRIGIVLEQLKVALNSATVLRSKCLQAACLPSFIQNKNADSSEQDCLNSEAEIPCWDYLIQGSGICVIMPYRLECRAIEDAIEDMWRGLKLVMVAQKNSITGAASMVSMKAGKKTAKVPSSVDAIRFVFDSITAEIEEEPLQGWFDEHHQMIRQQKLELDVREHLLNDVIEGGGRLCASKCSSPDWRHLSACGLDNILEGNDLDFSDPLTGKMLRERLQEKAFQCYHRACKKLQPYEDSGSARSTLQSGFRPSVNRGSLFLIQALNLEVTLLHIGGGIAGMIEQIRKLDSIPQELEIPYSRILGKRVKIVTSSLVIRLRNYTFPMLSASGGRCDGQIILARQATCFSKQVIQEVYMGRWRKLIMLRSQSGTTPPFKMFSELPIEFEKAEVAYGVGFELAFADMSYAFSVALRKADLSVHDLVKNSWPLTGADFNRLRSSIKTGPPPVKKERNLPWWDDMRYYVHGRNSIIATNFTWIFLATTNPYEKRDMMKIVAASMDIQQQDGRLSFCAKDFDIIITSLERVMSYQDLRKLPVELGQSCIHSPFFQLDITMDWDCESSNPLFHYLHALPNEKVTREKVYDPFRSTSLSLRWNFRLGDSSVMEKFDIKSLNKMRLQNARRSPGHKTAKDPASLSSSVKQESSIETPTMNLGAHDLIWIFKWWSIYYSPPPKLRTFSRWPRFGLTRVPRSGNLSLDKVLTEFMLRVDATPAQIKHTSLVREDPAEGLTFNMRKLKYELCYSRGKHRYTTDSKRDILELVYQGLDLHMLKADLRKGSILQASRDKCEPSENVQVAGSSGTVNEPSADLRLLTKSTESGFLFMTDYFSLRKQAPKADLLRLSSWQEIGCRTSSNNCTEFAHGSGSDPTRSDPSDDDGFNIVLSDNCLRISLYGLKLLWTIANRDAVWAWVEDISRAFESPKPSPSRQYAQRKIMEEQSRLVELESGAKEVPNSGCSTQGTKGPNAFPSPSHQDKTLSSPSPFRKGAELPSLNQVSLQQQGEPNETDEEGTMHFMVNVLQPQFNLHSEDARGRFLLAAASGKVIARSFHSIVHVMPEIFAQALRPGGDHLSGCMPELTWNRRELSVILEQVQAHVAPTDVDPGAGLQWLPKIRRGEPKVKRTGALLERVFMPCAMYFQYTRCKSETAELKVKPLKELSFNSPNITATMTSRQFQVMVDIIGNLLLARLPKPRKNALLNYGDEDDNVEEEADEVVPDGVIEVELARIKLEEAEREFKLFSNDLQRVKEGCSSIGTSDGDLNEDSSETNFWMMSCERPTLALKLADELRDKKRARKKAAIALRIALQKAAQQRFKEKEKNKSSPFAMGISWAIDKIVWSMISDGEAFAEAEISNMILNVDRDYHEVGIAQFTAKHFVVKNCLRNAKSSTVLSAWNPPTEWGRNVMLRVDAKQGAPKDGHSPLELFQVDIYPLKIYLTETMYRMMWDYFFPEEDQDSQRRQVWKASTTAVVKRKKKMASTSELSSSSNSRREQMSTKTAGSASSLVPSGIQPHFSNGEWNGVDFRLAAQILEKDLKAESGQNALVAKHRRTSSFDRAWDNNLLGMTALDIVPSKHVSSSRKMYTLHADEGESAQRHGTAAANPSESSVLKVRDSTRVNRLHKTASHEEKKISKVTSQDEKKSSRLQHTNLEFHNIKISQVELLVTYEGSRLTVNELRLLMDTFTRLEYTGTWRRLFSRVKKHIIWGVLKSVTGMQGKKFKDKLQTQGQAEGGGYPGDESSSSDSEGSNPGIYEQFLTSKFKRRGDRAGEGFVSSIRGLFNSQRRKAKAVVLRKTGVDGEVEARGGWTESEADTAPFTRQLSISKAKRLLRRHTKKFISSTRHRGGILFKDQSQGSPSFQSEGSSDASSRYEDFND